MIDILLKYIWYIIELLIGYNLVLPIVLLFFYKIKNNRTELIESGNEGEGDYAIIVTAYEQVTMIPEVVESLLNLNYSNYTIYVVADCCDVSTLSFTNDNVIVLRPEEPLRSNVKSHFYAIKRFIREHDYITIIDSDNLVDPEYLNELNVCFKAGFMAVQGIRAAKNLETTYARLDAARDIYYHFYDGEVLFGLGSSATLAGSGMAFTVRLYRHCLEKHSNLYGAGFDKVLQNEIVRLDLQIAFCKKAIVYDQKTSNSGQLVNQRARWINTWFKYSKFGIALLNQGATNWSRNQFLFGLTLVRPPLFIFLILSVFCMTVNLFLSPLASVFWLIGILVFIGGFYAALVEAGTGTEIYQSLVNIPKFIFYQLLSLTKSRKANEISVATRHLTTQGVDKLN